MFDMVKFIQKLEAFHTAYNISIDSITVMDNGWVIMFTCRGKAMHGMDGDKYQQQRVAFFEAGKADVTIAWNCIC